ncbi:MAG: hypothetical protein QM786_04290 [Breznakibacter sp.]
MAIEIIDGFKVNKAVPIDTQRTVVATLADRNAIPATIRYEGMETRVVATRTKYVLEGGIANTNWKPMVNSSIPDYAFSSIERNPHVGFILLGQCSGCVALSFTGV